MNKKPNVGLGQSFLCWSCCYLFKSLTCTE